MNQLIGTLEISKKTRNGKLLIAIPFWNKVDFFVSSNQEKKSENSPDFLIWSNKIKFGGLWKRKYNKDGQDKNYMSGSIFCPFFGFDKNQLRIVVFENQEKSKDEDIFTASVFWSNDEKKEVDSIPVQDMIMDNEEIF